MKLDWLRVPLLLAPLAFAPPGLQAHERFSATIPAVSGMRARLFRNSSADWSEDVLDDKYPGSWNTIAGPHASNATLVVVEVTSATNSAGLAPAGTPREYAVRLVARELGKRPKLLLDERQIIPAPNDHEKTYLPFLVHQGGCAPVTLTATIVGVSSGGKGFERTLIFACGE